ncbi:MAG: hypothetical protein K4H23_04395 [Mollicutes bacterium PWAP]|nr:hypothetical protein [Mollicutes bacterium PWAP]
MNFKLKGRLINVTILAGIELLFLILGIVFVATTKQGVTADENDGLLGLGFFVVFVLIFVIRFAITWSPIMLHNKTKFLTAVVASFSINFVFMILGIVYLSMDKEKNKTGTSEKYESTKEKGVQNNVY